MGLADEVREYVLVTYIKPARRQYAGVRLIRREGPHQGANLRLTFEV